MHQTVGARHNLNKGAEIGGFDYFPLVYDANLGFGYNFFHHFSGGITFFC